MKFFFHPHIICTEILEVNLFAFVYRLFHEDFSSINGAHYLYICLNKWPELVLKCVISNLASLMIKM